MTKQELRKTIIDKINKASAVYVHNGFTEFYFKTSKSDLLYTFRKTYKGSNYPGNQLSLIEWLKDFNDRATLNDNNELMFD
jgi:hypothetical protein